MSQKKDPEPGGDQGRLPHLLRIDELARRLGVSERHLRRLVQERRIPSLKVARYPQAGAELGAPPRAVSGRDP